MKDRLKFCFPLILWLVFFWQVSPALALDRTAPAGPFDIEAENIFFDRDTETYRAQGDVTIFFEGGYLKADEVTLYRLTEEAHAAGNIFLKHGEDIVQGETATIDLSDKTGSVTEGRIFIDQNHVYLSGKKIEKQGFATYLLEDASVTTCDGPNPDWKITGEKINVTLDGYGTIKQGFFKVKDMPLLYVPYLIFPAKTTRQSGFLYPRIAHSSDKLGWDIGIPFYWALSEESDATFYQRYMDKRGFQEGVEVRYTGSSSYGTFYGDYLRDQMEVSGIGETGELFRDWEGDRNRWSYYWDHETRFGPGLYLKANLKKVSDNWYFKDFSSYNYYLDHYGTDQGKRFSRVSFFGDASLASLDSSVRLVKDWDLFSVTALAQYIDDFQSYSNDETLQKYPEITFIGIEQPIFDSPFHFAVESSYGYYYRTTGQRGHLFDLNPVFSLPMNFGAYLSFTPEVGVRETVWDGQDTSGLTSGTHENREAYHIAATLDSEVFRIFNIGGPVVDKIRHGIRPEIIYYYVPYVSKDLNPDFVEPLVEENRVTYALTNTLTARLKDEDGNVTYREFLDLRLSQSYDIQESRRDTDTVIPERRPFSDITMELDFSPFNYFMADIDTVYSINSGEWRQINGALSVADRRGDSAIVEYRYTQNELEEMNLYLRAQATENIDLSYILRRNQLDDRNLEMTYGLIYHSQCWQVALQYTDSYDDRGLMCLFSLYGFGNVARVSSGFE